MKNKYIRWLSIIIGVFLIILVLGNFGLNYWLKHNLPDYIKKNTAYNITYKDLDVELLSGNILARGISINNKNPDESKKLGLQGTIDSLSISRFGIYDALVNKEFSTNDIYLVKPILNITLPEKKDKKVAKEKKPIELKNLNIKNGKIQIFKTNNIKMLSLSDLNLDVTDLELNVKDDKTGLPVGFDTYSIQAKDLYFRPDNVYLFTANEVSTNNGQLNINQFSLVPLLSYADFTKLFPKKRNLFNVQAQGVIFNDFKFSKNLIQLNNVQFDRPNLKMYTTNVKPQEKEKSFSNNVSMDNVHMIHAKIEIVNPNQTPLFSVQDMNFNIKKIEMNRETAKGNIPFQYDTFLLDAKTLSYHTKNEHVKVSSAKINPKMAVLNNIHLKTIKPDVRKPNFNLITKSVVLKIRDWEMLNSKLKMDVDEISVNEVKGKIATATQKVEKKSKPSLLAFPLKVRKIILKNSDLEIDSKGNPIKLSGLNLNINDLDISQNKIKEMVLKSGSYNFIMASFNHQPNKFYKLSATNIKVSNGIGQISDFLMKPLVSRAQFIRMIPTEKDLYNLKFKNVSFAGKWDLLNPNKFIDVDQVTINGLNADIFRSKIPNDDETLKPLYSKMLRSIKIPLFVKNLDVKNSTLVYEEDIPTSAGPGKLTFDPFTMNVKNINSGKMKSKPTKVAITINAGFMNASPLRIKWDFNTLDMADKFSIAGTVSNMPADRINPFIEPYLNITATGVIKKLTFDFNGNPGEISGNLKMQHDNLKVFIRKKNSNQVNKLLSGIANLIIKNSSGKYPETVSINNVQRDPTKSFFNLLWKGMQDGLAQTLIGVNYKKTEEKIKTTVENVKEGVKEVKETVKDVKTGVVVVKDAVKKGKENAKKTIEEVKKDLNIEKKKSAPEEKKEPEKKKGFFKKIFKKEKE